jgi:hypothetical protein
MCKKMKTERSKEPLKLPKKQQQQQKSLEFFVYGKKNGNTTDGAVAGKGWLQGRRPSRER